MSFDLTTMLTTTVTIQDEMMLAGISDGDHDGSNSKAGHDASDDVNDEADVSGDGNAATASYDTEIGTHN